MAPEVYSIDGWRVRVLGVGLACCAEEFGAAVSWGTARDGSPGTVDLPVPSVGSIPVETGNDGPDAGLDAEVDVLVISGTVTERLAPLVQAAYEAHPTAPRVISFGSCANSGGPYWDSPRVIAGVDKLIPVDVYVPGCPPRPDTLSAALAELRLTR